MDKEATKKFQTCDGNFRGPFTGAVQYALFDRLHVARVALVLNPKHRPLFLGILEIYISFNERVSEIETINNNHLFKNEHRLIAMANRYDIHTKKIKPTEALFFHSELCLVN